VVAFERAGDIWVVNADGTQERRLTTGAAHDGDPAWSADGLLVAFSRDRDIWVMNADGSGQHKVTDCAADPECASTDSGFIGPTFAPDGRIAFWSTTCNDSGYCGESIEIAQGDGSGRHYLTSGSDPAWSPRGDEIAFVWYDFGPFCSPQGCQHIYRIDPAGTSGVRPVTASLGGEQFSPNWTPDGAQLAFAGDFFEDPQVSGIFLVNPDGTGLHLVVKSGFSSRNLEPAVSPDGTKVAYVPVGSGYVNELSVVGVDGTGGRIVADGGLSPDWQPITNGPPRFCQIVGTAGDDVIEGTPGDDVICGLPGNDVIFGRGGNDGWGRDALDGGGGHDTCDGGRDLDLLTSCESVAGVP
jgi:Tol biopolymer transport system component